MGFIKIINLLFIWASAVAHDLPDSHVYLNDILSGQPTMSDEAWHRVMENPYNSEPAYTYDEATKSMHYSYDSGQSPFCKYFSVLKTPEGFPRPYILVDGHHTLRGTLEGIKILGGDIRALTIPIKIDYRFKDLSPDNFWQSALKEGLVYTGVDANGQRASSLVFFDIMDVPNDDMRGFLEATAVTYAKNNQLFYGSDNPYLALWLRTGRGIPDASIPFIEFYIADTLKQAGFTYVSGTPVSIDLVERARSILHLSDIAQKAKLLIWKEGRLINIATGKTPEEHYEAGIINHHIQ